MRASLKIVGSMLGASALLVALAVTSWACPPDLGTTPPSGPPGGGIQVNGEYFAEGSLVELHWSTPGGSLLGMAKGPVFLTSVRIPASATPGKYSIVAVDHATASVITYATFRVAIPVTAPVATQPVAAPVAKPVAAQPASAAKPAANSAAAQPAARASVATASVAEPAVVANSASSAAETATLPVLPVQFHEDSHATSQGLAKDVLKTAPRSRHATAPLNIPREAGAVAVGLVLVLGLAVAFRRRLRRQLEDPSKAAKVIPLVRSGHKPTASQLPQDRDRLSA